MYLGHSTASGGCPASRRRRRPPGSSRGGARSRAVAAPTGRAGSGRACSRSRAATPPCRSPSRRGGTAWRVVPTGLNFVFGPWYGEIQISITE
eukprot:909582-Prymnesium_polylepis.1